jgi:hypothetical protein
VQQNDETLGSGPTTNCEVSITRPARGGSALLLEGVVILVSILTAFFLEGWRDDRELAQDLELELTTVHTELERNLLGVEAELQTLGRQVEGLAALVQMLDAADGVETLLVPDTLAWMTTGWNSTLDPSLGAISSLISTGSLSRVDDAELRLGLAGIHDVFSDVIEGEMLARQIAMEQLAPLLGEAVRLDYAIGDQFFGTEGEGTEATARGELLPLPTFGEVSFPTDLPIRNAIVLRKAWLTSARSELVPLRRRLQRLIELISTELGAD